MALSTTPTVLRRYIAFELRRLRETASKSQLDAAKRLDTSKARIAHFESGRNLPKLTDVELLLPFYGADELVDGFRELIVQTRNAAAVFEWDESMTLPPGFDLYLGLEQGASRIVSYDAMTVMGILQCEPYAEALLRGHDKGLPDIEVQRQIDLRMRRQGALDRDESPVELVAVIDEAVLHRQIGGAEVLGQQLEYLLTAAERPNITIRVLPYSAGVHPALHGPFTILEFPIDRDPGVVYVEDRIGGRYRDDTEDIDEYAAVADRLLELALPEPDSASVIHKIREELS
ncbi:helix-turn-helix domain-containing protein [Saccharothrix deserti]|uniref:helix-turn-helix domain-containing protein n=1 Tax=Saccharothrix deserti TaxID=2593674 RepID=UPI00131D0162|nr:helix-turn-helix transcriptional regulator [Saccharothrix deserti]